MKIAFHFPRLASGGVEKMRIILAKELARRGIDVDFVVCSATGEYLDQIPKSVNVVDLFAPRTRNSLLPLVHYLKKNQPDFLISSLGPQNVIAIIAKKIAGAPTRVYVTQHNALSQQASLGATLQQRLVPLAYRWLLPFADGVISVSEGIAEDMAKATGFPRSEIDVIYNPAFSRPSPKDSIDPKLDGVRYILSVGRLVHQKGFDNLIESFALVARKHPEVNLVILGNGPLRSELEQLVHGYGLSNSVHFLGFQRDCFAYMRRAELFVLASRYEGFGNVLVEALSAGTPVVSTDCDFGPAEVLDNGRYGALVPVGDISAMHEAISEMLTSHHDRDALISRAECFSPEAIVDRYLEVLSEDCSQQ